PEERKEAGKNPQASLTMTVSQLSAGMVEINITDNGRGVVIDRVKRQAIKNALITEEEAAQMTREQAIDLIFQSGLSTSPIITEISGHGLGLAIVRDHVSNLGGRLEIETVEGQGTTFRMLLPVTIATFTGILISVCGQTVVLPKINLSRVLRLKPDEIKT